MFGSLLIGWVITTHYISILAVIALSPASIFGKIMMGIVETILSAAALNYLEELEQ